MDIKEQILVALGLNKDQAIKLSWQAKSEKNPQIRDQSSQHSQPNCGKSRRGFKTQHNFYFLLLFPFVLTAILFMLLTSKSQKEEEEKLVKSFQSELQLFLVQYLALLKVFSKGRSKEKKLMVLSYFRFSDALQRHLFPEKEHLLCSLSLVTKYFLLFVTFFCNCFYNAIEYCSILLLVKDL